MWKSILKALGLKPVVIFLGRALYFLVSLVEVPLFLLRHRAIFANPFVYVYWHWSFGHTVSGIDYASRLYYPHRISLLFLPHARSNPYVPACFGHNIDSYPMQSWLLPRSSLFDGVRYRVTRAYVLVLSALTLKFYALDRDLGLYKTLSLSEDAICVGREESGELVKTTDITGYVRLLQDGVGRRAALPPEAQRLCREAIARSHPEFLARPFITVLLRRKGVQGPSDDAFRVSGPQQNYVKAVQYAIDSGFHVVGTGEIEHVHFRHLKGYYAFDLPHLDPKLLNVFLLSACVLFIGQQSGPHVLPNACGVPCLLCDAMPYRLGTFCADDIILYKRLRERKTGRYLSLVEIFRVYPELAYGYTFAQRGVDIVPNTEDEIFEAVREAVARLKGEQRLSEQDRELIDCFRKLPAAGMTLRYQRNRPPLSVLQAARAELLAACHGRP